jgi:hypothetical protein
MIMTEFTDKVEEQKLLLAAEEWGKKIKYLHFNDGIEEVAYNNGKKKFTDIKTKKVKYSYEKDYKLTLMDKFYRAMADKR